MVGIRRRARSFPAAPGVAAYDQGLGQTGCVAGRDAAAGAGLMSAAYCL